MRDLLVKTIPSLYLFLSYDLLVGYYGCPLQSPRGPMSLSEPFLCGPVPGPTLTTWNVKTVHVVIKVGTWMTGVFESMISLSITISFESLHGCVMSFCDSKVLQWYWVRPDLDSEGPVQGEVSTWTFVIWQQTNPFYSVSFSEVNDTFWTPIYRILLKPLAISSCCRFFRRRMKVSYSLTLSVH